MTFTIIIQKVVNVTTKSLKYFAWETSNEKVCFDFHKALRLENKALLENIALRSANTAL